MDSVWIATIYIHQLIGTIGYTDQIVGTGRYANETKELCEKDGADVVAHMHKVMMTDTFSYKCEELSVQTTIWIPPEQRTRP